MSRQTGAYEIWTMNADGSDSRQLTTGGDKYDPAWSADGTRIAYSWLAAIWIMNSDGSGKRQVVADGTHPAWSPDGTRIAFATSDRRIGIAYVDGGAAPTYPIAHATNPAWSPDGTKIAYNEHLPLPGYSDLHVANVDGTGDVPITTSSTFKGKANWSPDGTKVAFSDDGAVVVVNADGTSRTTRGLGANPVWSPDGTKFAYGGGGAGVPAGGGAIWTMNSDGANQVRITTGTYDFAPDWQPVVAPTPAPPPPPGPPPSPPPSPPPPSPPAPPTRSARCVVPNVRGKTVTRAKATLRAKRCAPGRITYAFHRMMRKGLVIGQSKRPGTRHPRNTKVHLIVSKGPRRR